MLIKIINGTYGYKAPGSKHIDPKSAGDPPFEVDDAKAKRLVDRGVAAYVITTPVEEKPIKAVATGDKGENRTGTGVNTPEENDGKNGAEDAGEKPAYNVDMKADELKELMKKYGLSYKVGMTKAEMVAVLDELFDSNNEETDDDVTDDDDTDDTADEVDDDEAPPSPSAELPVT